MSTWPEIGIHQGIPAEEYHQGPGVSQTSVKRAMKYSLYHARDALLNPLEGEKADHFATGTATHTVLLEPHLFHDQVIEGLPIDRRSNANKARHAEFAAANEGRIILTPKEYAKPKGMAAGVMRNKRAAALLKAPGLTELSFVWKDEETGLLCRGRADRYCRFEDTNIVADIKTHAGRCDVESIEKAIGKCGYDVQAAFYLDGLNVLEPAERRFIYIFCEKTPPYSCRLFEASDDMIQHGRAKYRKGLKLWAEADRTGVWPEWGDEITKAELRRFDLAPEEDFYGSD